MPYITGHAYYGSPLGTDKAQSLPDRILPAPESTRHGLIDDHNQRLVFVVGGIEAAPALDGNTNRFEITCAHWPVIRRVVYAKRFVWTAFDIKRPGIINSA